MEKSDIVIAYSIGEIFSDVQSERLYYPCLRLVRIMVENLNLP